MPSLVDRFARVVAEHPDRPAVDETEGSLTYRDLDRATDRVALALREAVGSDPAPVGLLLPTSRLLVIAMLGTLKAGRAYLPLDPAHPTSRLSAALEHAGTTILLTDAEGEGLAADLGPGRRALRIDGLGRDRAQVGAPATLQPGPDTFAYVYYTSGSTGPPKGVVDTHRNVLHNVMRYTGALGLGPEDRLTWLQTPAFSGAVSNVFGALMNGAAVLPYDVRRSGLGPPLARWLVEMRPTIYHSVPSIFRTIATGQARFPSVRVVRLEGDGATWADVAAFQRHFAPPCVLAHGLGATETGLSCQFRLDHGAPLGTGVLPVGWPLPDVEVLVVDELGRPVPAGQAGELVVRSRYLAHGYWRDPERTRAAFDGDPGWPGRTYRSGDLARVRADGAVEHLGRVGARLRIGGRDVEAAPLEAAMAALPGVRAAAVAGHEWGAGGTRLVAYLVAEDGVGPSLAALRRTLAERLPGAPLPAARLVLAALPVDAHGKLDRRALPPPANDVPGGPRDRIPPRNDLEALLVRVWEDALGLSGLGVTDDLEEMGADSLVLAAVGAAILDRLGVALDDAALLGAGTIAALAQRLDAEAGARPAPPGGRASPVFLVDSLHGDPRRYVALAGRLGDEHPLRVLRPEVCARGEASIPAVAERCLAALAAPPPAAPPVLAGFCSGAAVAFEMAHRLREAGTPVAALVLCGISPLDFPRAVPAPAWWRYRCALPLERLGHSMRGQGRSAGAARTTATALRAYRPRPWPGPLVLYLARRSTRVYSRDPARTWARLAAGSLTVHELPGGSVDLFRPPAVDTLAAGLLALARGVGRLC